MIETQVKKTLEKTSLKKDEKILVAISGGKDSTTTAYVLKKFGYNVEGIFIDLCVDGYSKKCLKSVQQFCNELGIKLRVYDLNKEQGKGMRDFWSKKKNLNHCAVCGVFKKWILNRAAREGNFDYLATGHNLDDETETVLLNVCKGSLQLGMNLEVVTRNRKDRKFVPRLKPLFYLENREVREFAEKNKLRFVRGVCPYREESYRVEIRNLVGGLPKKQKLNVLKNFERLPVEINEGDNYCDICGEPARGNVCKLCGLKKGVSPFFEGYKSLNRI